MKLRPMIAACSVSVLTLGLCQGAIASIHSDADPYGIFAFQDVSITSVAASTDVAAGGDFSLTSGVLSGNVVAGGSINSTSGVLSGAQTSGNPTSPIDFATAASDLTALSIGLSGLATNGSISTGANLSLTGAATNTSYVFNLTESQWESASSRSISLGAGSSAVINIAGADLDLTSGLFYNGAASESNVLLNYFDATTVDYSNNNYISSILAPNAALGITSASYRGQLIANSVTFLSGSLQGTSNFAGELPSLASGVGSVPEASSFIVWCLGATVGGLVASRRRR